MLTALTTSTRIRRAISWRRASSAASTGRRRHGRAHDAAFFSYEPGTTGGEKKQTSSSGSGPSDSVAWNVPGGTQTITPASISAVASGVTIRPRPAAQ